MLSVRSPDPVSIASALDRMSHNERLIALQGLRRDQLRLLYAVVEGFAKMTLDDLVPATSHNAPLYSVRHVGRNSLPMFSHFEKRFYRLQGQAAVGGANFQSTSLLTGPGYFTATASAEGTEIIIDYSRIPETAPAGWPALANNEKGLARWVYGGMFDTLRRVSSHVSIGAAQRVGRAPSAYFALCRQPEPEDDNNNNNN